MKIGEIYFIRERDRQDGEKTSYVKIGVVSDSERGSSQRLKEHQTGNPRDLELRHVVPTPNPFKVETFLHRRYSDKRTRSEWFSLSDQELSDAIQVASELAAQAHKVLPILDEAKRLGKVLSTGEKRTPTPDAISWHKQLLTAKEALKVCKALNDRYRTVLSELEPSELRQVEEEELAIRETYLDEFFDHEAFTKEHKEKWDEFVTKREELAGRFTLSTLDIDIRDIDQPLSQFEFAFLETCERIKSGELTFVELFSFFQQLERFEGSYKWDEEIADAHLRVLCGDAPGIEDLCSWKRTMKVTEEVDIDGLKARYPSEVEDFTRREMKIRIKTKRRARRSK